MLTLMIGTGVGFTLGWIHRNMREARHRRELLRQRLSYRPAYVWQVPESERRGGTQ